MNLTAKKIKAGNLDRLITIQQYKYAKDSYGQDVESGSTDFTTWAQMSYQSGDEKTESNQTVSLKRYHFVVRYDAQTKTITERNKIAYDGKTYEVRAVGEMQDARNRFLIIKTELID